MYSVKAVFFFFLSSFSFFLSSFSFSQSSTLEIDKENSSVEKKDMPDVLYNRVMVIPFEPKMYMSEIDKEISEKTEKNQNEISEIFRKGICNTVFIETKMAFERTYSAISMHSEDPEIISDLDFIYKSFSYKYIPIPLPPDTAKPTAISTLKKATDKAQNIFEGKKEEPGTKIQEGQIISTPETREKYMSTTIVNPDALNYLSQKYECQYFVFINQMDLVVPPNTDYRDLGSDDYSRLLKLHYAILDKNGNAIYGNAVKIYFSSTENDANSIVNSQFNSIAKEITMHLPNPNQPKAIQEKKQEEQKNAKQQRNSYDDY